MMINCSSCAGPTENAVKTINKALNRYRFRHICREITAHDSWLLRCAESSGYRSRDLGHRIHSPETLMRLQKLLEEFGASTATAPTHAKVFVLALLLAGSSSAETRSMMLAHQKGIRGDSTEEVAETARQLARQLGEHFLQLCINPDATFHRAKILVTYPQFCMHLKSNWMQVFAEVRQALAYRGSARHSCSKPTKDGSRVHRMPATKDINKPAGSSIGSLRSGLSRQTSTPASAAVLGTKLFSFDRPLTASEQAALRALSRAVVLIYGTITRFLTMFSKMQ